MSLAHTIERKVREALSPTVLEVLNESHKHNVPKGAETHFRLLIVAEKFQGLSPVARHREIYRVLTDEMKKGGVHALSLETWTPAEWSERAGPQKSPPCQGGSKA